MGFWPADRGKVLPHRKRTTELLTKSNQNQNLFIFMNSNPVTKKGHASMPRSLKFQISTFSSNLIAYGLSEVVSKASRLLVVIAIARSMDAAEIGIAAAALSGGDILKSFTQNGVNHRVMSAPDDRLEATAATASPESSSIVSVPATNVPAKRLVPACRSSTVSPPRSTRQDFSATALLAPRLKPVTQTRRLTRSPAP